MIEPEVAGDSLAVTVKLPVCTSCNKAIMPNTKPVKFYCPNCGQVLIWRCELCRRLARPYRCVNCLFEGP